MLVHLRSNIWVNISTLGSPDLLLFLSWRSFCRAKPRMLQQWAVTNEGGRRRLSDQSGTSIVSGGTSWPGWRSGTWSVGRSRSLEPHIHWATYTYTEWGVTSDGYKLVWRSLFLLVKRSPSPRHNVLLLLQFLNTSYNGKCFRYLSRLGLGWFFSLLQCLKKVLSKEVLNIY